MHERRKASEQHIPVVLTGSSRQILDAKIAHGWRTCDSGRPLEHRASPRPSGCALGGEADCDGAACRNEKCPSTEFHVRLLREARGNVLRHAERQRHDCECGVRHPTCRKYRASGHIQVRDAMDLAVAIDHTLGGPIAHSRGADMMLASPGSSPECSSNRYVDGSFIDRQHHPAALAGSQFARDDFHRSHERPALERPHAEVQPDATHAKGIGVAVFERDPALEIRR